MDGYAVVNGTPFGFAVIYSLTLVRYGFTAIYFVRYANFVGVSE